MAYPFRRMVLSWRVLNNWFLKTDERFRSGVTSSLSTTTLSTGRTPGPSNLRGSWMSRGSSSAWSTRTGEGSLCWLSVSLSLSLCLPPLSVSLPSPLSLSMSPFLSKTPLSLTLSLSLLLSLSLSLSLSLFSSSRDSGHWVTESNKWLASCLKFGLKSQIHNCAPFSFSQTWVCPPLVFGLQWAIAILAWPALYSSMPAHAVDNFEFTLFVFLFFRTTMFTFGAGRRACIGEVSGKGDQFDVYLARSTDTAETLFTSIKGFHIGDARVKKLTPASKHSIGRHVEFWCACQKFWRRPTTRHQRENPYLQSSWNLVPSVWPSQEPPPGLVGDHWISKCCRWHPTKTISLVTNQCLNCTSRYWGRTGPSWSSPASSRSSGSTRPRARWRLNTTRGPTAFVAWIWPYQISKSRLKPENLASSKIDFQGNKWSVLTAWSLQRDHNSA